jgi:O-antigen/teichoic acid export membrane protein
LLKKLKGGGLLKGVATYLLSNILSAIIPFALLPILTRYLTPAQYGEVAMFQMTLVALGSVTGLSVAGAASRKNYDADLDHEELKFYIGACLQILAISIAVELFFMAVFQERLAALIGVEGDWLYAACGASAANFIVQLRMTQWQIQKRSSLYGMMQVFQGALNVVLSLLLVIQFSQGSAGRVWAQLITSLVFAGISLVLLDRDRLLGFAWRPHYVKEALQFGAPLIPHSFGILLFAAFDRFMINSALGLSEVGIYTVAMQVASTIGLVSTAINNAYVPWLFERLKRDDPGEKTRIVRLTYVYFTMALLLPVTGFFCGPFAIRLIAGARYAEAGEVVGWLVLANAIGGMYLMVTNYVFYSKKTGLLALVTICTGVLNAAMITLLIGRWGLVGAAVSFATAMVVRFLCTWALAQLRHPMPWFSLKSIG